ncbi:thrombopoietin receptor [Rhinoderma darwinii]|uniref:thrombopoietin receptor n=1 Tax=Rhinoderma darwinii TaxID=43563 RepID=UPI003F6747ED
MRRRLPPVTMCTLLTLLGAVVNPKVTEEDLLLLSEDHDVPHCFSRSLETVVCYWEAEELLTGDDAGGEDVTYGFYYFFDKLVFIPHRGPELECDISVQTGSRTLYVCEHDEIILFNELHVLVRDKMTNRTLCSRKIELERYVILPHPCDIKVLWEESYEQFRVTWEPPKIDFNFEFKYEVQFWSIGDQRTPLIKEGKEALLPQLEPGLLYHVRIRTSWKEVIWGPWSEALTFASPRSADTIGLQCFTSDLSQVCCKWDEKISEASFLQVYYRYGQERKSTWRPCEDSAKECHCAFPAKNNGPMSVKLNVTFVDGEWGLYYNKPFLISYVVLPPAPDLHVQQLPGIKLALNWTSPIPNLQKHLMYQIRFSTDNEKSWTTLQVSSGVHSTVISMVSDTSYVLQIRASPNSEEIKGFWSDWSARVTTKSPSSTGWVTPVSIVFFLLILAGGLCLPCIFPSYYRKLKNKLWPPLPNLHSVLDTFLVEIQKQYQPDSTLYEKTLEEAPQSSCLEILGELTLTNEGQQVSRDYVQLAPPSYQNEDYWPNLEPLERNPDHLSANNQLPCSLTNQTYLPTGWSLQ